MTVKVTLTDRGRAALAAGITLTVAGMALGFAELSRVGLVAVGVVLVGLLLVLFSRPRLDVETRIPATLSSVGRTVTLPVTLTSRGRSPLIHLEHALPAAVGGEVVRALVPSLGHGETFTVRSTVRLSQRGRHRIPTCVLHRYDPFGFALSTMQAGTEAVLTVLPRIHTLDETTSRGSGSRGDGHAPRMSPLPGDDYASVRDYRIGDDLRRIHWPITAHRGVLMSRHDERTSTRHALLVLDPRLGDRSAPQLLEWGVEMLASAAAALDRGDVSLDLLTGTTSPVGDGLTLEQVLLALATTPPVGRPPRALRAPQDPFVSLLRDHAGRAGLIVLVAGTGPDTRDLLVSRPPTSAGLVCLVSGQGDDDDLADLARRAGWAVAVCTPRTPHAQAWKHLDEAAISL